MMGILHVNKPSAVEAFRVALGHLNRIRSLDVFAEFYTNPKWFMKLKDQDLPELKFLTLSKKDHHYRDDIYLPWISKIGAPQLQGLDVQYFAFKSYQKFLLPSLTSLSISGGRFPPLQLLSVLRDLPYLRQLSLTAVLRYSSLEDGRLLDSPKDIVHMAHVQHLSLRGTILVTSIILANLSLPVVTDVEIILESLDCTLHEHFKQKNTLQLSQVLVPIMSLLSTIVPPTSVTKLAFTQGKREGRRNQRYSYQDVVGWGMRTISPMDEQSSRFLLSVLDSQYALHPSRDAEEMLGVVLPTLAAVDLEYLQVGAHITSAKWKEWFGQCNHVTRLSVTGPDDQFLDALHPEKAGIDGSDDMPKVEGNNVGEGTMLFPRLKCLRLEEDSCELYTRELLDKLVSALRSRKSEGCGLANLDVRGVREWSEDLRASLKRTAEMVTLRPPAEVHAEKDIGEFEAEKPNGADRGCQKHDKEDVVGDESSDEEDDDDDRHSYW
ncbi:hypothetical protein GLOTRDRAFT_128740 [Gloeophyllum trabeum ATCC 11539]|uniref:F-box domain-containing protein n=1 Tax=Gloeophyllum trabeum (strain ATCC 11539 / FP-39264 / Madison 617) TaxID=670483 RepID=S7RRF4_GLOTA|nr:uncharacterized protein GLOTRDRAFT_128740 [Gloeophyllum trabeum ATCC 11539]EPQ55509.1 hypothetical protein GLOTRDRAFT_128740 [Gloeophyllum trabeum ATCC 11539]